MDVPKWIEGGKNVNYTTSFNLPQSTETYTMRVQAYVDIFGAKGWLVAETNDQFKLSTSIIGWLNITQEGTPKKSLSAGMIAVGREASFRAHIHDPEEYLKDWIITYQWILPGVSAPITAGIDGSVYNHTFTDIPKSSPYLVSAIVKAEKNVTEDANSAVGTQNSTTLWGEFNQVLTIKDPVSEIKVVGNTWLQDGALLMLDVSCGVLPSRGGNFKHCYSFLDSNSSYAKNYTCRTQEYTDANCNFPIQRYFPSNGTHFRNISHFVAIGIGNEVSFKRTLIEVHIYNGM